MIIDTHVHMTDGDFRVGEPAGLSCEKMVDFMDMHEIAHAWISPVSGLYGTGEYALANRKMYEFIKKREDRFIGFMTVNPNYGEKVKDEIKRCVYDYGFRGMKLHTWLQGCPITHPNISLIVEECIRYQLPVKFHDGTPPYASSTQAANLAYRYPEATIILGHAGLTEMVEDAVEAARVYSNVLLSLTGPSISQLQYIIDHTDENRVMFGTDFGVGNNVYPLKNRLEMFNFVTMTDSVKRKLMYENAQALLPK